MNVAYLSLGANLGDRQGTMERALRLMEAAGIQVKAQSSFYETAPQEMVDQPWFLNMVAQVATDLGPTELLSTLQEIERELGRDRIGEAIKKGPRTIDIDILLFGDLVLDSPDLTIPHPGLCNRRFVLAPLAELEPSLRVPGDGRQVAECLNQLSGQDVRRV